MACFRKLADKSAGPRYDERTGQLKPWPLLGLMFIRDSISKTPIEPPGKLGISVREVARFIAEGLMNLVNERVVTAPAGPPRDPNKRVHTFRQADELHVHTLDAQGQKVTVRYKIVSNPGKRACTSAEYLAGLPEKHRPQRKVTAGTLVDHTYQCELIGVEPRKIATA